MSDFDKEAEREKLREQLEQEEDARETTQHMSELLLKGATMTNKHCDECGDPVFRYQGQEFCPTCGQEIVAGDDAEQPERGAGTAGGTPDTPAASKAEGVAPDAGVETTSPGSAEAADQSSESVAGPRTDPRPNPTATTEGDVGEARAALVRKLTRLAQQAEATDDAGRSRDLLAAAREAAEALAAVDQVGQR